MKHLLQIIVFICLFNFLPGIKGLVCPHASQISPCTCDAELLSIRCNGPPVSQHIVNEAISSLKQINIINNTESCLNLNHFWVTYTVDLVELDLSPFAQLCIEYFNVVNNQKLQRIFVNDRINANETLASLRVSYIDFRENNLTDEGLADTLLIFDPMAAKSLVLSFNQIMGPKSTNMSSSQNYLEFLPGLSRLKNLEILNLYSNKIESIPEGSPFRENGKLRELNLGGCLLRTISQGAFVFGYEEDINLEGQPLKILLHANLLQDSSFQPNHGLWTSSRNRPTTVFLQTNQFDHISQQVFLEYLEAHKENALEFLNNKFLCDKRMSWLKERRNELENRVLRVDCLNDPGETVFSTNLI